MKIIFPILLIMFAVTLSFSQSKAEREVRDTVDRWADSILKRDTTALGKILADEIVITDYNGAVRGKAQELEAFKPIPLNQTLSVENEDLNIKILGKTTAVVTSLTKMKFNIGGMETGLNMRYTAVFVKQGGRWQIIVLQTTKVTSQNRER